MCAKSYALGRWRGARGKPHPVLLCGSIDHDSYSDGYLHGEAERHERAAARRTKGRR